MYTLEKQRTNVIELEDGITFEDSFYVKVGQFESKQETRRYIKKRYNDEGTFRMIAPGGAVSNPMSIKLQEEGHRLKPDKGDRLMHRVCDDYDPIIVPTNPIRRMQYIAKALREEER